MLVLTMGSRRLEVDSILVFRDKAIINSGSTKLVCEDKDKLGRIFDMFDIKEE